jgi:hypothetical protein
LPGRSTSGHPWPDNEVGPGMAARHTVGGAWSHFCLIFDTFWITVNRFDLIAEKVFQLSEQFYIRNLKKICKKRKEKRIKKEKEN